MEADKRLKMTGFFSDFTVWADTLNEYTKGFFKKFNVYPNIFLANEFTFRRIDLIAQMHPDRIRNKEDGGTIETSDVPYDGLNGFVSEDYSLEMCLDYDLQDGYFTLIFDEDPDFSGEPLPAPEEKREIYHFNKKTA